MKSSEDQINVVFACNNNYAQHTAVAMASILLNAKHPEKIKFFVILDEVNDDKKNKLAQTVLNLSGGGIQFLTIKTQALTRCFVFKVPRVGYYRIDIPNIVDESIKKIIYLDCDLVVCDDIEKLWNINIQNKPIAAALDFGIALSKESRRKKELVIGLPCNKPYFNSGVLIIDVAQWRENNYSARALEIASKNKLPNQDQDVLNKLFMDKCFVLPIRWNITPPVAVLTARLLLNDKYRNEAVLAKKYPALIHYAGALKPWQYKSYKGLNDKYYAYLQRTAFKDVLMPQFNPKRKPKFVFKQFIRVKRAEFIAKILGWFVK